MLTINHYLYQKKQFQSNKQLENELLEDIIIPVKESKKKSKKVDELIETPIKETKKVLKKKIKTKSNDIAI